MTIICKNYFCGSDSLLSPRKLRSLISYAVDFCSKSLSCFCSCYGFSQLFGYIWVGFGLRKLEIKISLDFRLFDLNYSNQLNLLVLTSQFIHYAIHAYVFWYGVHEDCVDRFPVALVVCMFAKDLIFITSENFNPVCESILF